MGEVDMESTCYSSNILEPETVTCPKCNETWDYKDTAVTQWCSKCGKLAPIKSIAK